MRFLEGWPLGNRVLDGLGQDVVSLMKDSIAKFEVLRWMARSRKYGPGSFGFGYGQFDKGLNS